METNMNSTRIVATPKPSMQHNKVVFTEPRNFKQPIRKAKETTNVVPATTSKSSFRTPVAKVVTNRGRVHNEKWRQLIDENSDSEGDNASDDEDADESWSKNASEIEENVADSDFEISPMPRTRKRNKNISKGGRSANNKSNDLANMINKSKEGELVYLDLTKDEVEIQEVVPESPPANHDKTFATRLQDILKTCRHEDKPKLPASNKKTKRKLFTPKFGDEDFETATEKSETGKRENVKPTSPTKDNKVEDILIDDNNCPFDSHARPKVLTLINKQLESVKTGKPIFQLTPSPKKREKEKAGASPSKSNTIDDNFKTPLTTKCKGPAKSLRDLCLTPDFKYSFLKSLDGKLFPLFYNESRIRIKIHIIFSYRKQNFLPSGCLVLS